MVFGGVKENRDLESQGLHLTLTGGAKMIMKGMSVELETNKKKLNTLRSLIKDDKFYRIMSAIRGPDSRKFPVNLAKTMTTAVIRSLIGVSSDTLVDVYTPKFAISYWKTTTENIRSTVKFFLLDEEPHFWRHVCDAFEALISLEVPEAKEYYIFLLDELQVPSWMKP